MDAFGEFPLTGFINPQPKGFCFLSIKMASKFDKRQRMYFVSVINVFQTALNLFLQVDIFVISHLS